MGVTCKSLGQTSSGKQKKTTNDYFYALSVYIDVSAAPGQLDLWLSLCLPEQPKLSQQSWVGAALLRAGLARRVMFCSETFDLCQDLSGK